MIDKILGSGIMEMTMTTTTVSPEPEVTTRTISSSSRLTISRTSPPRGYPKKVPTPDKSPRKLTYLPPPPPGVQISPPGPLRRSAYKTVKYSGYK